MIGRLDAVDCAADEIDEACRAVELPLPVTERPRIQGDVTPWAVHRRSLPRKKDNRRARRREVQRQGNAEKSAAAGDDDRPIRRRPIAHCCTLSAAGRDSGDCEHCGVEPVASTGVVSFVEVGREPGLSKG